MHEKLISKSIHSVFTVCQVSFCGITFQVLTSKLAQSHDIVMLPHIMFSVCRTTCQALGSI